MEPDDVDGGCRMTLPRNSPTAVGVKARSARLRPGDRTDAAENRPQPFAELSRVGDASALGLRSPDRGRRSRTIATSIPSSEVPLISPRAHHILGERCGPVARAYVR